MKATLTYTGEFTNEKAVERGMELVVAFMRSISLPDDQAPVYIDYRVCAVAKSFLRWACERNKRAFQRSGYNGSTQFIQIHLTVIQQGAIQIMVMDCGGKEHSIPGELMIPSLADYVSYDLFNGGLLMRAVFKWE